MHSQISCSNISLFVENNNKIPRNILCILLAFLMAFIFCGNLLACVDADTTAKDLLAKNNYAKAAIVAAAAAAAALLIPPPAGEIIYAALLGASIAANIEAANALSQYNYDLAHQCCPKE